MIVGDYVLATKWSDGDPLDPWAVGFLSNIANGMFTIKDGNGKPITGGFRRIEKISKIRGRWLLQHTAIIEQSGRSVWYWSKCQMEELNG